MPLSATSRTSRPAGIRAASRAVVPRSTSNVAQVAVVDADQIRARRQRALELHLVVYLDQGVEPERPGPRREAPPAPRRRGFPTISRTASAPATRASSIWYASIAEVLAQQRQGDRFPNGSQDVEVATEVVLVGEHREARRPARRVVPRAGDRVEARADLALARRAPLQLRDHRGRLVAHQGLAKAPGRLAQRLGTGGHLRRRRCALAPAPPPRRLCGEDLVEDRRAGAHAARGLRVVAFTRASSFAAAAPESMLARAPARSPRRADDAFSATHSAAAAASSTTSRRGPVSPSRTARRMPGVLAGLAPGEVGQARPRQAELRGIDLEHLHRTGARVALRGVEQRRVARTGRRELVEPVRAVHHQGALGAERAEGPGQGLDPARVVDSRPAGSGRPPGSAAARCSSSASGRRAPARTGAAWRIAGWARRAKNGAIPTVVEDARRSASIGRSMRDPERLEDVEAAGAAAGGAVAVLRHGHAGARPRRRRRSSRC